MQLVILAKALFDLRKYLKATLLLWAAVSLFACSANVPGSGENTAEHRQALLTPVYQVNCGGGAVSPFSADQFGSGGSLWTQTVPVTTAGVPDAAPESVYWSERYGSQTYTFGNLTPGADYIVRLHFAENKFSVPGARVFDVLVNGAQVLSNFDIFVEAGYRTALVRDIATTASSSGQISVQYVTLADNAKSNGIEILADAGAANEAPNVATPAAASPSTTSGTTSALSVLGADDGGEESLTYTWSTLGTPPAPVGFAPNGDNVAKATMATFSQAGSYTLQATISDAGGASVTSSVNVVVDQTLSALSVLPASAQVQTGGYQQFTASAEDQFGLPMSPPPSVSWDVSGGGVIDASGLFAAGSTSGGPFTVSASAGALAGTASLSVTESPSMGSPVYQVNCGGGAVSPFSGDQFGSGGATWTESVPVSTAGVDDAAPESVYWSERYGNQSYTFNDLVPGQSYVVRLHFAENRWTSVGARVFSVVVNGAQVLTNFDIFAEGGYRTAVVRDFTTTASGSGQISVQYVTVADNAKSNGIEILTESGGANQPPTLVSAAAANPATTSGTTTLLSVLGADDAGEANLTYTWSTVGSPPAPVSFSPNGHNAAKNATATFSQAGSYTLQATIRDANGASVTSNVSVVVSQQTTGISVSPSSADVETESTQLFSATAHDQFGLPMSPQPSISWTVSGGGSIDSSGLFSAGTTSGGPFVVSASSGGATGNASVSVSDTPSVGSPVYQVNCGGGAVSPFSGDQFGSGGSLWTQNVPVNTAGVVDAAPEGVYQSERWGNQTYTFGSLTPGASYIVRLHFAETKYTAVGARVFNVVINGAQVLTGFDIFAAGGFRNAVVREFTTTASGSGQISVQYVTVADNAKSSGIEILTASTGPNDAPTVASPASASPSATDGTTTSLDVLGADDGGEANLTYTWSTVGSPPAPVSFSPNGSHAAKSTTASFSQAGSYTLQVTIRDANGATATSSVSVVINQKLTGVSITPSSAQVQVGNSQQFSAVAADQFARPMSPEPSFNWSVNGGGSIDNSGLFSAGAITGGPFIVSAGAAGVNGNASVSVTSGVITYTTTFDLTQWPISEGGLWVQNGLDWTSARTANGLVFGTQSGFSGYDDSYAYLAGNFPANQSASAVIHLEPGVAASYAEVEILLRWRDSDHYSTGYECNLAYNGQYAEIIRWPGPLGTQYSQFTFISQGNPVAGGVHDGDVFQADVVGNVITSRLNGQVIAVGVDNALPSGGAPGIGFYWEGGPATQKYSFTEFSATGL